MAKTGPSASGRRARRSAAEWRTEVAAWRASGVSARDYAQGRGIHAGTLMGWASRLSAAASSSTPRSKTQSEGSAFLPVRVKGAADAASTNGDAKKLSVEIALSGGRTVRLSGELGLGQLARLLDAIEGRGRC
jgi:hypothetical protein